MKIQRYFMEVFYKGTDYSGFQVQQNANSIQAEIEKAFSVLQKQQVRLTGASRTDTGVHALRNYFHFDLDGVLHPQFIYKINAILPGDIGIKNITKVSTQSHCRFDAISREYNYYVYRYKNPFLKDRAYYFPYTLDIEILKEAAAVIKEYNDFTSFSKRNSQVKNFECIIESSEWIKEGDMLVFNVKANRFLRGMVRGLTGTMLQLGRGKSSITDLRNIILAKDCTVADFSVPSHGLFLVDVQYPTGYFENMNIDSE